MSKIFLNIKGATILTKSEQKSLTGGAGGNDPSLCGCDCAGNVTGPFYCVFIMSCPQVYNC